MPPKSATTAYSNLFVAPLRQFQQKLLFWFNTIVVALLIVYCTTTIAVHGNFPYPTRDWVANSLFGFGMILICIYHYRCLYLDVKPSKFEDWLTYFTTIACFMLFPIVNVQWDLSRPLSFLWDGVMGVLVVFALNTLASWKTGLFVTIVMIANIFIAAYRLGFDYVYNIPGFEPVLLTAYLVAWPAVYLIAYLISLITVALNRRLYDLIPQAAEIIALHEREQQQLSGDMRLAQQVQYSFHPTKDAIEHPHYDAYGFNKPAQLLSGDYFDLFVIHDRLYFGIGDVSGHGIGGAFIANNVRILFHTYVRLGVTHIPTIIERINSEIFHRKAEQHKLMNMSLLLGYIEDHKVHIWGRHEQILHMTGLSTTKLINTHAHGTLLGVKDSVIDDLKRLELELGPQELLLFYTDGVTEHENVMNEPYGLDRLQWMLVDGMYQAYSLPSKQIVKSLLRDLEAWNPIGDDDTTLLVIRRK